MYQPSFETFESLTAEWSTIPVFREIQADWLTPVAAFQSLRGENGAFLLESVEGGENWARYSIVGGKPAGVVTLEGKVISIQRASAPPEIREVEDPVSELVGISKALETAPLDGLPRFSGGLVGTFGYDTVRHFEDLPAPPPDPLNLPDGTFFMTGVVVVFDAIRQSAFVLSHVAIQDHATTRDAYEAGCKEVQTTLESLQASSPHRNLSDRVLMPTTPCRHVTASLSRSEFRERVERAKEYIRSGDIIQVVLSRRFSTPSDGTDPFEVYRILRALNPSPYLFYFDFPGYSLAGSSPEVMVRYSAPIAEVRPIAGTRRRGGSDVEDKRLEAELRQDPKEVAEHIMLLDLGRNDIGRISEPGSVEVADQMIVERYSHVMHMVSTVRGKVLPNVGPADVIRATFPAGTLSGAPKVRALEVIDELEPIRRGVYGGAVGFVNSAGEMDLCIAIRCLVAHQGNFHVQAGAGIVFDSDPEKETDETEIKAQAVLNAIQVAREINGAS